MTAVLAFFVGAALGVLAAALASAASRAEREAGLRRHAALLRTEAQRRADAAFARLVAEWRCPRCGAAVAP